MSGAHSAPPDFGIFYSDDEFEYFIEALRIPADNEFHVKLTIEGASFEAQLLGIEAPTHELPHDGVRYRRTVIDEAGNIVGRGPEHIVRTNQHFSVHIY